MMKFFILLFIFIISLSSKAIEFEDGIFPELATSSRALAMGNAFIAKTDDSSAVFYNPAGLGTVRYPHLHLSNFTLETNKGAMGAATAGNGLSTIPNMISMMSIDGTREVMKDHLGKLSHSRMHFLPNFTTRYFSMGYLYSSRTRGVVNNLTATGFEYADRTDKGPYASLNFSLFGGIVKFGASGIYLSRKEIFGTADPNVTLNLGNSSYKTGTALIITSGVKVTLPITYLPTFAAKINNTMGKDFSAENAGAPATIKKSIDVGFSITPQIGTSTRIHLEANYKDLTGLYNISTTRRMLLGMEMDFGRMFFFRIGYGDAYGCLGIGVKTPKVEFDLTTYSVDTTYSTYRGQEDRRFVAGFSTGF